MLIASDVADELVGPDGVRLDALHGLKWSAFRAQAVRRGSTSDLDPAQPWRRHRPARTGGSGAHRAMKFASVSSGHAFALAPPRRLDQLPEAVTWAPLVGNPVVRRTWAVWLASSRRRDVGHSSPRSTAPTMTSATARWRADRRGVQDGAVDVAGVRRHQKGYRAGDFVGVGDAAQRRGRGQPIGGPWRDGGARRLGRPCRHRVRPHAGGTELVGPRPGEQLDARLVAS